MTVIHSNPLCDICIDSHIYPIKCTKLNEEDLELLDALKPIREIGLEGTVYKFAPAFLTILECEGCDNYTGIIIANYKGACEQVIFTIPAEYMDAGILNINKEGSLNGLRLPKQ